MTTFQEYFNQSGRAPEWPYPLKWETQQDAVADILVLGGGISGCWAAISAARKGAKVIIVEKAATIRSGSGGPGCDHWCDTPANPLSRVNPDDWAKQLAAGFGGYGNGIGRQIQCRENYDTLLEMENLGGKIRDTEDQWVGIEGRDAQTKFMISPRFNPYHDTNTVIRIWGTTFKPALRKECLRLGIKIFDRTLATSLLTEKGEQGTRVVGATAVNNRTGEFLVIQAKATILTTAGLGSLWNMSTEMAGYATMNSRNVSGDGTAMAWKAGAELVLMEKSGGTRFAGSYKHKWYTGAGDASYENVNLMDAAHRPLPIMEPGWGKRTEPADKSSWTCGAWGLIRNAVKRGDYNLPFYGDFPGMLEKERRVIWEMMLQEESCTKIIIDTFNDAGFNPSKDYLQNYNLIEGASQPQWREASGGGLITDWNLKTSLDGLYAAGTQLFSPGDHSFAASTGRYAGRKAADYALQIADPSISQEQVALEKARVYAPVKKTQGLDWKELHSGIARTMQYFCSEYKDAHLLKMGLEELNEIEAKWVPALFALDPHQQMRAVEDLSILTCAQIVVQSSLARQASSRHLDFQRIDFPQFDPAEWNKFITLKLANDRVIIGEKPLNYCGNLKANYEANNPDYQGVWKG